jgi:glycosyltransferase involved in cell wall biosynthesis
MRPLVSIVIPTHRPSHFRIALLCALSQTYTDTEIIVSDNSSSNEIAALCAQYPQKIRYRKNSDGRASSNIALPLSMARGEFIKYLFDDDIIYPHCIDSMMGWLDQIDGPTRAGVGLITSARHLINDNSLCFGEVRDSNIKVTSLLLGSQVIQRILMTQENFIGEFSTVLFRRNLIDVNDPERIFRIYGDDYRLGLIDVPLYLAILQQSNLVYIPYALSAFRKHRDGGSNVEANPLFHHAVSDWFRLIIGADRAGLLQPDNVVAATRSYLILAGHFQGKFQQQLAPWKTQALALLKKHGALA